LNPLNTAEFRTKYFTELRKKFQYWYYAVQDMYIGMGKDMATGMDMGLGLGVDMDRDMDSETDTYMYIYRLMNMNMNNDMKMNNEHENGFRHQ
jgi:hypothetical protein